MCAHIAGEMRCRCAQCNSFSYDRERAQGASPPTPAANRAISDVAQSAAGGSTPRTPSLSLVLRSNLSTNGEIVTAPAARQRCDLAGGKRRSPRARQLLQHNLLWQPLVASFPQMWRPSAPASFHRDTKVQKSSYMTVLGHRSPLARLACSAARMVVLAQSDDHPCA